jgi:hypothetical protein
LGAPMPRALDAGADVGTAVAYWNCCEGKIKLAEAAGMEPLGAAKGVPAVVMYDRLRGIGVAAVKDDDDDDEDSDGNDECIDGGNPPDPPTAPGGEGRTPRARESSKTGTPPSWRIQSTFCSDGIGMTRGIG